MFDLRRSEPGVPFSTMKPRIASLSSVLAQTTAMSAIVPLVIQALLPLSSHPSFARRARVLMLAGFDPEFGSVNPKQPMISPAAIPGRYFCRCSSLPKA